MIFSIKVSPSLFSTPNYILVYKIVNKKDYNTILDRFFNLRNKNSDVSLATLLV